MVLSALTTHKIIPSLIYYAVLSITCWNFLTTQNQNLYADSAESIIQNASAWLLAQQNNSSDIHQGSFGSEPTRQIDTHEAFKTFMALNGDLQARIKAIVWFNSHDFSDTDFLARKLELLSVSTLPAQELIQQLEDLQNADGGWGLSETYESSAFHTLQVLNAFTYSDLPKQGLVSASVFERAVVYLIGRQSAQGDWAISKQNGDIFLTASIVHWLSEYIFYYRRFSTFFILKYWNPI